MSCGEWVFWVSLEDALGQGVISGGDGGQQCTPYGTTALTLTLSGPE